MPSRSRFWSRIALLAVAALALVIVVPLFFAGSPDRLADGTRINGVDVGGLTVGDATELLAARAATLANVPVTFTAGTHQFRLNAHELGVRVDWAKAVAAAQKEGGGVGIVRGFRRISLQLFPENFETTAQAYKPAVDYELGLISATVDTPHREARLVRRGLHITIAAGHDRAPARQARSANCDRRRARLLLPRSRYSAGGPRCSARHGADADERAANREPDRVGAGHARRSARRATSSRAGGSRPFST